MRADLARLVLLRHGQTAWSHNGRHTGATDVPLTPTGERQAEMLGAGPSELPFALVLTSPRQRARSTAALAGLTTAQVEGNLSEWDYGGYEGRTTAEISSELGRPWTVFADGVPAGTTPGETLEQVGARADAVLSRVQPVLADGGHVALVGHAHQLRILTARWLGLPPGGGAMLRLDAGTLSQLGHEHGVPVIDLWNATPP